MTNSFRDKANFIWQVVGGILRGTFQPHECGDAAFPFVVLRRLDQLLRNWKDEVLAAHDRFRGQFAEGET